MFRCIRLSITLYVWALPMEERVRFTESLRE